MKIEQPNKKNNISISMPRWMLEAVRYQGKVDGFTTTSQLFQFLATEYLNNHEEWREKY